MTTPPPATDPDAVARAVVLRRLAVSARTRHELEQSLARKNVPPESIHRVLDRMEDLGLVDDREYAAAFVDSRRQRPGWSRRSLSQRLRDKGVDRDIIESAMAALPIEDELATAASLVRSRWHRGGRVAPQVRERRMLAMLARRGYSAETARTALDVVAREQTGDRALSSTARNWG